MVRDVMAPTGGGAGDGWGGVMVAARTAEEREAGRLPRGARGRYAPPPQLFPLAGAEPIALDGARHLAIERAVDGAYLIRRRDDGRLIARTADSATLQRLLMTLTGEARAGERHPSGVM